MRKVDKNLNSGTLIKKEKRADYIYLDLILVTDDSIF